MRIINLVKVQGSRFEDDLHVGSRGSGGDFLGRQSHDSGAKFSPK